ncbi:TPA: hypothetical protein DEP26_02080 [Candidatus Uhrbacteria bacterium]|nr:hypothetical protein [Candidatus Uhrbacteria bacterium]
MSYDENHENEVTYFARTNFRNQLTKFGIRTDDRRRHMYVIGKTGMGKTTLLENLILSDIYAGHGCCYVDPHGDTAEKLIDFIPSWRLNDVVYFNPSDVENPIGFNIFEAVDETHKHLVASGMMGVFKKIWEDQWSSRMEYILNNSILALLDNPGSTLLGVNRLLSDPDYRKRIIGNVRDPIVKQFWLKEFASYNEKYAQEAVAPIQNKIGQFLSSSVIRNIVAQVKSTINIRQMMDTSKVFIINLSKGRIGEDSMRLLGGMLITKIQLSAMERVDMPEKSRRDFYLYVDEFQNFAVESFASILSEARKYHLCLTMAHQYIAQLTDEVREAVFGNVGSIVTFRVGSPDADYMETEFGPRFLPEDLINIPKYNIYLKLLINGVTSPPFSAVALPPIAQCTHSTEKVLKISRERYSLPRAEIEEKVLKWSGMEDLDIDEALAEAAEKKKAQKQQRKPMHEYNCTECGEKITLPVELDRSRPIYCEKCIEIIRERRNNKGGKPSRDNRSSAPVREKKPEPKIKEGTFVECLPEEPSVSLSALVPRQEAPKEKRETREDRPREDRPREDRPKPQTVHLSSENEPQINRVSLVSDSQKKKRRRRKKKPQTQGSASQNSSLPNTSFPTKTSTEQPAKPLSPSIPLVERPAPNTSSSSTSGSIRSGQSVKF